MFLLPNLERERETTLVGDVNIIFCLKVPRQCPLVLLIGVRSILKLLKLEGLR
jgi:hypothetical protein